MGSNYILAIIVAFIGASFITLGRKKTSESNDSLFVFNQNQTELETYYREINYVFDTSLKIMDIIHPYLIESVGEKPIVTPEELQTGELDFVPIKYINGFTCKLCCSCSSNIINIFRKFSSTGIHSSKTA